MKRNATVHVFCGTLLAATLLLGGGAAALADDKPLRQAAAAPEIKDERALKLLKEMTDTLAGPQTLAFKARGLVPIVAPTGQYVSLFGTTRVVMQRPDGLFVESRGDLVPNDLYYNGKTLTAIDPARKFYAQQDVSGSSLDAVLEKAVPAADTLAPFVDLLVSDPYARMAKELSSAIVVGQSMVGGANTDHLAFTAPGIDWEVWIGVKDKLPRLVVASYRGDGRQPNFTVEFSDWKLNAEVPAKTFEVSIPKDAVKLDFKLQGPTQSKQAEQGAK